MIELPMLGPDGGFISFGSGQPMGAFSSWPSFALSHHTVVRWAAIRAGKGAGFSAYRILGDDIVITDGTVAREYEILLGL
jgi:hypothetical protein